MRLTEDTGPGVNIIRAYADGELWIKDRVFRGTVIVSASLVLVQPDIRDVSDLAAFDASLILAHSPEVVLLGTGRRQHFPDPKFGARYLNSGVGFEAMDTGAACRTFNVLVSEQRRVVALLLV